MPKKGHNARLNVEYIPIDSIKAYSNNTKIHAAKQLAQIKRSIEEFGYTAPVLVDEELELIAGHGRVAAARMVGMTEIPAIRLAHLSDAQKKAYRIADNKLTELGEWDLEKLQIEFRAIEMALPEMSLDITGFEMPEIEGIVEGKAKEDADPAINAVPFVPPDEIISKPGDVWLLGNHKIICGNSLKKETFAALMEAQRAQMVFTDPPYNIPINGHAGGKGKHTHKEFAMASGEMTKPEFQNFLTKNFALLKEFSVAGSLHYICMNWLHAKEILLAGDIYDELKNIITWCKANGGMGSLYRSQTEFVFLFKNGKARHINNVQLGSNRRYRTNFWQYGGVNSFGKEQNNLKMHPTCKPVEMVKDAILDVTKRGDIVLDAFLGSGSTLIAAENCNRVCYGIEIEPLYIDTTIRRFQTLTGKDAVHADSGKTYKKLLEEIKEGK